MAILNAGAQFGLVSWTLSGLVAFGLAPTLTYGPTYGPTDGPTDVPAPQPSSGATATAGAQDEDARAAFDALVEALDAERQAFEKASREWYDANHVDERTASEEAQREFNDKFRAWWNEHEPSPRYLARFEALATQHRGSEVALDCWLQVIELDAGTPLDDGASAETSKERPLTKALAALLGEHLKSEKLEAFCIGLQYGTPLPHTSVIDALTKIRAGSPHRKVQAAATFALASEHAGERGGEAGKSAARALYAQLAADFADVSMPNGKSYQRVADGYLFELDHLQVGKQAPDFEAVDETGARFKLSDYRGKVVMLDFWGFW